MKDLKTKKINLIQDSLKLEKIPDKIYFGPDYKDYISNSYMGLINPDEGGFHLNINMLQVPLLMSMEVVL